MSRAFRYLRTLLVVILGLALGALGLSLLFSDLGPDESIVNRLVTLALFFFFSGALIGLWRPRHWWLAGITAWASVLLALSGLLTLPSPEAIIQAVSLLLVPLGLTLAGGRAGAFVRQRHVYPTLVQRIFPHR